MLALQLNRSFAGRCLRDDLIANQRTHLRCFRQIHLGNSTELPAPAEERSPPAGNSPAPDPREGQGRCRADPGRGPPSHRSSLRNPPESAKMGQLPRSDARSSGSAAAPCSPTCRSRSGSRPVIRCGVSGSWLIRPSIGSIPPSVSCTPQKVGPRCDPSSCCWPRCAGVLRHSLGAAVAGAAARQPAVPPVCGSKSCTIRSGIDRHSPNRSGSNDDVMGRFWRS